MVVVVEKNLLKEDEENELDTYTAEDLADHSVLGKAAKNHEEDVILLYFKPSIDWQLVEFSHFIPKATFAPELKKLMNFYDPDSIKDNHNDNNHNDKTKEKRVKNADSIDLDVTKASKKLETVQLDDYQQYYPIFHPSEFWITSKSLIPVNGTLKNVTIEMTVSNAAMWKFTMMAQMEEQWKTQDKLSGNADETDMLRTILLDTNPYLLAITFVVTILHTIFDVLAFKNDISFFKGNRSMEGLSVRSMVVNAFFQVVIFLYLMDNDTSFMVLASNGVGLAIEFWKISKAIRFTFANGKLQWVETTTYAQSKTKEYDQIATDHLLYVTMPLVAGYGMYSLIHMKHKNYYSWILGTLVGFIYMFGFVMMTPQVRFIDIVMIHIVIDCIDIDIDIDCFGVSSLSITSYNRWPI